ncbi:MAG: phosphopantetheine adenylyltransferase [Candidatus Bathyarchaeota archaeon]|nr:phosphopantetheine adenylyltransferase [Candidatus Bathyarchaeota archaeon]MDH5419920.1 phosphopantetheine adenylyltransferase [Candidatus Bathyarchaeota archaeon]MDH5624367.1 phosphopantetheine adenylyltransferase [Candidatus Bathyarchaeota archaeon]MDH5636406.1 phosphopantetheine adenylyltransferase [Candidatus Bathyarchaeota archaeon]
MEKKFETVAVGGTFDEFHKGHRALLKKAFEVGNRVLIGLCADDFVKKLRKPHNIASYEKRLEELKSFLRKRGVLERAEIVPLNDPYGVTVSRNSLDAIVVSRETEPRAHQINEKRRSKGRLPLKIVVIEMILAEDYFPISSTRIWIGEIDHEGHLL